MKINLQVPANTEFIVQKSPDEILHIGIDVAPGGEILPVTIISASGGRLDCYKSRLTTTGDIVLHPFGVHPEDNT